MVKWFFELIKIAINICLVLLVILIFFGCSTSKDVVATEKKTDVSLIKFQKEETKWQDIEVEGEGIGLGQKVVKGIRQGVKVLESKSTALVEEE